MGHPVFSTVPGAISSTTIETMAKPNARILLFYLANSKLIRNLMKTEFLEKADCIAADNVSSSHQILKDTLDLLSAFSGECHSEPDFIANLKSLLTAIAAAQSQMSALSNVCGLVISASDHLEPEGVCSYLKNLRNKMETVSSMVASHASGLISDGRMYATISQSEFVLKTFEHASSANRHCTVFVMESRPLFEGRQTAKELTKMGHHAALVSDASIGFFINEIDSAIVGADSILSDGTLINKIGSYSLAACCAAAKKDFYAVTSILKYDSGKTSVDFINKEEDASEIYANTDYEVRNFYFDMLSPEFVTAIVTEAGIVSANKNLANLDSLMHELYDWRSLKH
jgi:translation initiation factor 2B subunit (eIF-2B alpha/beta/delta family)